MSDCKLNFYRKGQLVKPPANWKELSIELNFDRDKNVVGESVDITEWNLINENADACLSYIDDGLTTGVGVFEGEPLQIEVQRGSTIEKPFDGFLDYTTGVFSPMGCSITAKRLLDIEWLNDRADSFTFEYLYKEIGSITTNDFIKVPYVISSVPNYTEAAVAVLSVYVMVKEVKDSIQKILEFGADAPVVYNFGTYVKIVLYIIYLVVLLIALIKLIKDIILLLIQPVKYHAAMSVNTQLQKGAEYLGYTLKAPDFESGAFADLYLMPEKFYNPINAKEKRILGFTEPNVSQEGYFKGTFGDLLRYSKQLINGKVIIKGNELWLVRKDYNISLPQYTLPPITDNGYPLPFTLNTDEFKSNTYITFATDLTDLNTHQNYLGTAYQAMLQPLRTNNESMVLMKGLEEIRIPFARTIEKTSLTVPEQIVDTFLTILSPIVGVLIKAANAIINVLNSIINTVNNVLSKLATIGIKVKFTLPNIPTITNPDLNNLFKNRKGMMLIEKDLFTVPKLMILNVSSNPKFTKLSSGNLTYLNAKFIYDNFYAASSFMPSTNFPNGNQFIKKNVKVPFIFTNFEAVKNNNKIYLHDGTEAWVDSLKWNPWEQTAEMAIRINKLYTNNLKLVAYEPTGQ